MAELGGLRSAIQSVIGKLGELRDAIDAAQASGTVQTEIDEIKASVDEIGATVDDLIADAKGETTTETPAEPAP